MVPCQSRRVVPDISREIGFAARGGGVNGQMGRGACQCAKDASNEAESECCHHWRHEGIGVVRLSLLALDVATAWRQG